MATGLTSVLSWPPGTPSTGDGDLGCYTYSQSTGGDTNYPSISPDGGIVGYANKNGGLSFVASDGPGRTTVALVPAGQTPDAPIGDPVLSDKGARAAFASTATNLVSGDSNAVRDVFYVDRGDAEQGRVSVTNAGSQANGASDTPSITSSGTEIAFGSDATNLVTGDTNAATDAFLRTLTAPAAVTSLSSAEMAGGGSPSVPCAPCAHGQTSLPVDTATGNFWHSFEDFAIPGRGLPLHLTHTYNSQNAAKNGPLGYGWTHSYNLSLVIAPRR